MLMNEGQLNKKINWSLTLILKDFKIKAIIICMKSGN